MNSLSLNTIYSTQPLINTQIPRTSKKKIAGAVTQCFTYITYIFGLKYLNTNLKKPFYFWQDVLQKISVFHLTAKSST